MCFGNVLGTWSTTVFLIVILLTFFLNTWLPSHHFNSKNLRAACQLLQIKASGASVPRMRYREGRDAITVGICRKLLSARTVRGRNCCASTFSGGVLCGSSERNRGGLPEEGINIHVKCSQLAQGSLSPFQPVLYSTLGMWS